MLYLYDQRTMPRARARVLSDAAAAQTVICLSESQESQATGEQVESQNLERTLTISLRTLGPYHIRARRDV